MSKLKSILEMNIKDEDKAHHIKAMVDRIITAYDMEGYTEDDVRLSLLICTRLVDEE